MSEQVARRDNGPVLNDRLRQVEADIAACLRRDRTALQRRLKGVHRRLKAGKPAAKALGTLERAAAASRAAVDARRQALPPVRLPPELPISEHHEELVRILADHQVVVICGETGSGKSTQLPKLLLEAGAGLTGWIGSTQPRRIAARTLAGRLAAELGESEAGGSVGYKVRFTDKVSDRTFVKLMTDGILLAETRADPELAAYDALIIDEAHERSLNIDFLIGYLKQLLPRHPGLKVVISSATIDPERFSKHFFDAPIVEVSGRTWPVEVRYRPLAVADDDRDLQQGIVDAVDEASRLGPGDMLVFLPGEREIRETAEALRKHHPPGVEVLPLYARLSTAEQNKVFAPAGRRRIVLATNVAETSLTVPGIRYVIDPGNARVSRYSHRARLQRLPVEKISRASADQRKGRCGRVGPGVCLRLYSEADYEARPAFTDPEILRTSLASVILQMKSLGFGDVERFPFLEPPSTRMIQDGYRTLRELGALDAEHRLTDTGRQLARLPVDPRVGRMILAARDFGALAEVLVIAAALSIQDPRERPMEAREAADRAHAAFTDASSDFLSLLNLWRAWRERQRHLSHNKLRQWCRDHYLAPGRMREWRDIHQQLYTLVREMGFNVNTEPASYEGIHRAILAGLLCNVGSRTEKGDYISANQRRFSVFPGSALFKAGPKWAMCAEIAETTRIYGRCIAAVQPEWVEAAGAHIARRSYREPYWDPRSGRVKAFEQVSVLGLVVASGRRVDYGPVDPAGAREVFIREALCRGRLKDMPAFLEHNQALVDEIRELEHKSRRPDVLVDDECIFAFYDARVPSGIHTRKAFDQWRRDTERKAPRLLFMDRGMLLNRDPAEVTTARFPDRLVLQGIELPLSYHFEPGHPMDGVTLRVPIQVLNQVDAPRCEWLVPGLLHDKVVALIKGLPKHLRRYFVPAPDFATACVEAVEPGGQALTDALGRHLHRITGIEVPPDAWPIDELPDHLRMNFEVVDAGGERIDMDRDLVALRDRLGERARDRFQAAAGWPEARTGLTRWDFGDLPSEVRVSQAGVVVRGAPALVDEGESVGLDVFDDATEAARVHAAGLRRLFMLQAPGPVSHLRSLPAVERAALPYAIMGPAAELREDIVTAAVDRAFLGGDANIRTAAGFQDRADAARGTLAEEGERLAVLVEEIVTRHQALRRRLKDAPAASWLAALADIQQQLDHLVYRGFVRTTPPQWLAELPRYLKGVAHRLDKLEQGQVSRDRQLTEELRPFWEAWLQRYTPEAVSGSGTEPLAVYRWMIEEMRISLFAQPLGTALPVSTKRLRKQWEAVLDSGE